MGMKRQFEVWNRSTKRYEGGDETHELHLLIVPDGTRWNHAPQFLHLSVAPDFEAEPGDVLEITVERVGK
jgi:hypothetical protein